MAKLFGREYSKSELLSKVGDISQLGGVKLQTFADGKAKGVRAADFRTGSGLDFTVVIDRALDITKAEYKGQPLAWRSSTGEVSPTYYEPNGIEWLRSFEGGLVTTAGLVNAGAADTFEGRSYSLHGRISNLPASNVYADGEWDGDSYIMWIQGKVRQTSVFFENIEMTRRITAKLGESKIWIHDKVTNLSASETPHMMLYHCNIGFPVVDEGSRLIAPVASMKPRDADAEVNADQYASIPGPIAGFKEQCYYLDIATDKDGMACAAVVNPNFNNGQGFGVYMRFPKNELPKFTEWKNPLDGMYVVGLEPANCWVEGISKEKERGTLQYLKPGETREYHLEIGVLSSQDEIRAFETEVKAIKG